MASIAKSASHARSARRMIRPCNAERRAAWSARAGARPGISCPARARRDSGRFWGIWRAFAAVLVFWGFCFILYLMPISLDINRCASLDASPRVAARAALVAADAAQPPSAEPPVAEFFREWLFLPARDRDVFAALFVARGRTVDAMRAAHIGRTSLDLARQRLARHQYFRRFFTVRHSTKCEKRGNGDART